MSFRKFGRIYGIYIGVILVAASWLMNILGLRETAPGTIDFMLSVILIGGILYSITQFRENYSNGFITYKEAFKVGISVSLFLSIIVALAIFIDYKFTDNGQKQISQQNEIMYQQIEKRKNENQKIKNKEPIMVDSILSANYYTDSIALNQNINNPIYTKIYEYFVTNDIVTFTKDTISEMHLESFSEEDLNIMANTIIQKNKEVIRTARLSIKVNKPHYLAFGSMFFLTLFCSVLTAIISFFVKKNKEV